MGKKHEDVTALEANMSVPGKMEQVGQSASQNFCSYTLIKCVFFLMTSLFQLNIIRKEKIYLFLRFLLKWSIYNESKRNLCKIQQTSVKIANR